VISGPRSLLGDGRRLTMMSGSRSINGSQQTLGGRTWSPRVMLRPELWLILVPLAFVAVFFGWPLIEMLRQSVTDFIDQDASAWSNYAWFLMNETQVTILVRTVVVSILVVVACLLVGFPYAYLMTLVGPKVRLLMLAAILLPFWTSLLVRLYAWVIILQPSGPILTTLEWLGIRDLRLLGTTWGVALGSLHILVPFMVLTLYAALTVIDRRLLDAAQSLGASPRSAFLKVYLPLAVPGILAGSTIVFVFMMGFYFTPAFLGSTQNSLISQQIVVQISRLLAFGRGSAMALVLLVVTMALLAIAAFATRRLTFAVTGGQGRE
jgi:putative spermidine/putrescine transport system permease protein